MYKNYNNYITFFLSIWKEYKNIFSLQHPQFLSQRYKWSQLQVHWWVNKLVFLICYLSLLYLDLIWFYLNIISFLSYFTSIANNYISVTNIWRFSLGAKERGLWVDSGWKYEIWDKNMPPPKSETWHGPCPQWHGRATLQSLL